MKLRREQRKTAAELGKRSDDGRDILYVFRRPGGASTPSAGTVLRGAAEGFVNYAG